MNNKELGVIRLLELIKYLTLKGKRVTHFSPNITFHRTSLNLETPEGPNIDISIFRINFNGRHNKIRRSINVDYGFGNSTTKEMKPSMVLSKQNDSYHQYSFVSEEFRRQSNDLQLNQINQAITLYNSGTNWYTLNKSVLIEVSDANKTKFETYLNRIYGDSTTSGTWKYYFDVAVTEAKNGDFTNLNKYHHIIYEHEIPLDDRKGLLNELLDQSWGFIGFGGLEKAELFTNLVLTCPEQHKLDLYEAFFANSAKLFSDAMNKLADYESNHLAVLKWLILTFYSKQSASDIINIRNKINNFREDEIIPIISREYIYTNSIGFTYSADCGPIINKYYTQNGFKINSLTIRTKFYVNNNPEIVNYTLSNGTKLDGKIYKFDDIIGGFTCNGKKELGIMQHKIYAFPAFAVFELHNLLSANISILDIIGDLVNQASFFIPFFKITQGIKISANLIGIGIAVTGLFLTDDFIKKAMQSNNQSAIAFIYGYQFFASFYGIKSLREAYKTYKMMLFLDCESLIDLWGQAQTIQFFSTYENTNNTNYLKIKADMQEITRFKMQLR